MWILFMLLATALGTVEELTRESLSQMSFVKEWVSLFHAPWCKQCEEAKEAFQKAGDDVEMLFLFIDCDALPDYCKKFAIKSFPTLKYKFDEEVIDYPGERTYESLIEFVRKVENSAALVDLSREDYIKERQQHRVSFTLYAPETDTASREIFTQAAEENKLSPLWFFIVPNSQTYVMVTGEDSSYKYVINDITEKSLKRFIKTHYFPTLVEIGPFNFAQVSKAYEDRHLAILSLDYYSNNQEVVQIYRKVANSYRSKHSNKIQFWIADGNFYAPQFDAFAIDYLPALVIIEMTENNNLFAKIEGEELFSQASVERWVYGVLNGEIQRQETQQHTWWSWIKKGGRLFLGIFSWQFISENPLLFLFITLGSFVLILQLCLDVAMMGADEAEPEGEEAKASEEGHEKTD